MLATMPATKGAAATAMLVLVPLADNTNEPRHRQAYGDYQRQRKTTPNQTGD